MHTDTLRDALRQMEAERADLDRKIAAVTALLGPRPERKKRVPKAQDLDASSLPPLVEAPDPLAPVRKRRTRAEMAASPDRPASRAVITDEREP